MVSWLKVLPTIKLMVAWVIGCMWIMDTDDIAPDVARKKNEFPLTLTHVHVTENMLSPQLGITATSRTEAPPK